MERGGSPPLCLVNLLITPAAKKDVDIEFRILNRGNPHAQLDDSCARLANGEFVSAGQPCLQEYRGNDGFADHLHFEVCVPIYGEDFEQNEGESNRAGIGGTRDLLAVLAENAGSNISNEICSRISLDEETSAKACMVRRDKYRLIGVSRRNDILLYRLNAWRATYCHGAEYYANVNPMVHDIGTNGRKIVAECIRQQN